MGICSGISSSSSSSSELVLAADSIAAASALSPSLHGKGFSARSVVESLSCSLEVSSCPNFGGLGGVNRGLLVMDGSSPRSDAEEERALLRTLRSMAAEEVPAPPPLPPSPSGPAETAAALPGLSRTPPRPAPPDKEDEERRLGAALPWRALFWSSELRFNGAAAATTDFRAACERGPILDPRRVVPARLGRWEGREQSEPTVPSSLGRRLLWLSRPWWLSRPSGASPRSMRSRFSR
mmetsp:Transcript_43292/g.74750  ORF Transcript_43292/g.74750 Transcript_43292/m.74750 type:complete len:237 (-) Transcript_43292:1270-1980(-)